LAIKVLIADDHALLREGLRKILEMEPDIEVVGEAADGREAAEKASRLLPDVVLMDINMPGGGGLEATKMIRNRHPHINVVVLTIHDDDEYIVEMLNAGAAGYILKDVEPAKVIDAIHRVHEGESFIPSDLMTKVFREFKKLAAHSNKATAAALDQPPQETDPNAERLTSRELEVLQAIVNGKTNREIANLLFISEKTVKNHVTNILKKLDLSDRTQAAVYALRHSLAKVE